VAVAESAPHTDTEDMCASFVQQ